MEEAFFVMWPPSGIFPKLLCSPQSIYFFNLHDFLKRLNSVAQDDLLENACYLQIMNVPWKFQHLSRELGIVKKKIEAKLLIPFEN